MAKKYKTVTIGNCRQCPYLDSPDAPYFHDSSCTHPATKIYTRNYEPPDVSPDNIPKGCPSRMPLPPTNSPALTVSN